jgi:hypothetical protein
VADRAPDGRHEDQAIGWWRLPLALLFVSAGLVVSVVVPTARADRGPTAAERTGIEQAASREYGEPGVRVEVHAIKVSNSARSWATAGVDVDYGASIQDYQAEFRRRDNGSWTGAGNEMPAAVKDDLGLSDTKGTAEKVGSIVGYVLIGLIAVALLTLIVWLSRLGGGRPLGTAPDAPPSAPGGSTATYMPSKQKRQCPACGGRGRSICSNCGGRGRLEYGIRKRVSESKWSRAPLAEREAG